MEKTLYLSERQGMRVSRDGPSLWIVQPGQAGRRVPARLIRRVLIVGNVALDSGSLALFAERGVPVTLLSRQSEPVATVLGVAEGDAQRRARQAALLEDRARREQVAAWLSAWEHGRQLVLLTRLDPGQASRWRREGFRRTDYDAWVVAQGRVRGLAGRARGFFLGALHELVVAEVGAGGWDPHVGVRHRTQPLGFVKDCVMALRAEADRLWLEGAPAEMGRASSSAAWAARFEAGRPRVEALLRRMLDQYAGLLWRERD